MPECICNLFMSRHPFWKGYKLNNKEIDFLLQESLTIFPISQKKRITSIQF